MARRFSPDLTALLDPGAEFHWRAEEWSPRPGSNRLSQRGAVVGA